MNEDEEYYTQPTREQQGLAEADRSGQTKGRSIWWIPLGIIFWIAILVYVGQH